MRKVTNYLWMFMMAATVLFVASCGEDTETTDPILGISISASDTSNIFPGDTLDLTITLTGAPSDAEATVVSDNGGNFLPDNTITSGETVEFVVPDGAGGDQIILTFTLVDGSVQESEQITLNIKFATVVQIASSNPDFSTLVQALTTANLVTALQGDGPFTVFAPTNAAFEALTTELGISQSDLLGLDNLGDILQYHVLSGRVLSTDLQDGPVETLEGSNAFITTEGGAMVNDVTVTTADIQAGNGVVHVIDAVLLPQASIIESTAVLLGGQLNTTTGSFYNVLENTVYSASEAESNGNDVDLLYWFTETSGSIIGSPDNEFADDAFENTDFTTIQNSTRFQTTNVTTAQFDAIASQSNLEDQLSGDFSGNDESRITSLSVGQVFAFKLDEERGGNEGLVKVAEISGEQGSNRQITLDVKTVRLQ